MTEHARLSFSKSERWINCPGSMQLPGDAAQTDEDGNPYQSVWALEGTAAHALAEQCLAQNAPASAYIGMKFAEQTVTPRMATSVQLYLDVVYEAMEAAPDSELYVERRVILNEGPEPMYGTADAIVVSDEMFTVVDYKNGSGKLVEADDWQFRCYAVAARDSIPAIRRNALAQVIVVQPNADHQDGPVRRVFYTAVDLDRFAEQMVAAAKETRVTPPLLRAGGWCQFCPAAGHCPELARVATEIAPEPRKLPDPEVMTPEQIGKALTMAPLVEQWFTAMRRHAEAVVGNGGEIPGLKRVAKRTHRKWSDEEKAFEWLKATGLDPDSLLSPRKLRTPADIERQLKPLKKTLDPALTFKPEGFTLVPVADKRPAVTGGSVFDADIEE